MTTEAAASLVGVTKGTWSKWENGKVTAARVGDVARATGIRPEHLRPDLFPTEVAA